MTHDAPIWSHLELMKRNQQPEFPLSPGMVTPARLPLGRRLQQSLRRAPSQIAQAVRRPDPADIEASNSYLLVSELFWAAILSSMVAFGGNLAVRLGATTAMMGILSSVPSLIVVILTLPAARWVESSHNRLKLMFASLTAARCVFLLIALMPFFVPRSHQAIAFVILALSMQLVLPPFNAGWTALVSELVPERQRITVISRRQIINSAVLVVLTPLVGKALDLIVFPYGYQIAYFLGFIAGMLSMRELYKMRLPPDVESRPPAPKERLTLSLVRQMLGNNHNYMRFVFNTLMFDMGAWMIGPLYILRYLRELGATDSWVGTLTAVANASVVIGATFWPKFIRRWGNYRTLRRTAPAICIYPLVASFAPVLWPLLVAAVADGILAAGINLSHFNSLLQTCPAERKPTFISLYSVIMNAGAFIMPLIGVALADRIGITPVLIIGGTMRFLGGLGFTLRPVVVKEQAG